MASPLYVHTASGGFWLITAYNTVTYNAAPQYFSQDAFKQTGTL